MMDDIYSSKFLNKSDSSKRSSFINNIFSKVLLSVIFFLSSMIFINYSDENKALYKEYVFDKSFDFSYFTNTYNKYFGSILPVSEIPSDTLVFNENISYNSIDKYNDGYVLNVGSNYLVPFLQSGIIVFVGDKDNYGNTIIVQGIDGVDIWYCNVTLTNYTLYDYVESGSVLGESISEDIYLFFSKDGNYIGYEEYFN